MQTESKHFAETFNGYGPKKKIDFLMSSVLQFIDRDFQPIFHSESYVEGEFEKYKWVQRLILFGLNCNQSRSSRIVDILRKNPYSSSAQNFTLNGQS